MTELFVGRCRAPPSGSAARERGDMQYLNMGCISKGCAAAEGLDAGCLDIRRLYTECVVKGFVCRGLRHCGLLQCGVRTGAVITESGATGCAMGFVPAQAGVRKSACTMQRHRPALKTKASRRNAFRKIVWKFWNYPALPTTYQCPIRNILIGAKFFNFWRLLCRQQLLLVLRSRETFKAAWKPTQWQRAAIT
jgi:hypothetical protein